MSHREDDQRITASAVLVQNLGQVSRYEVTVTITMTAENAAQAIQAVVEAVGELQ